MRRLALPLCLLAIAILTSVLSAQDLKPEEIIAKHIETVGKKELRDQIKTLFAVGLSSFESQFPIVKGGGKVIVVSDRDDLFFAMSLNSKDYPYEKIGYFRDKVSLPFITSGDRSLLGTFLNEHQSILSEGLFTGEMSLRWPFFDQIKNKTKLKSSGIKKLDGKKVYVIDYSMPGVGSDDFSVKFFFDVDTFNHVRSEYRRTYRAGTPQFGQQNQTANSEIVVTESFTDFKTVDGLTLPYTYSVDFASNSNTSSYKTTWGIRVAQYYINQKLAPDFFTFEPK
jgi:hypothetical protein